MSDLPLHVEVHGAGSATAETFVLIHGYGACGFTWRSWVDPLAARGRVVLVDLKGFGSAPKPRDGRYSPADQAELVGRLVHERDLRDLTLVGHSLGGSVGLILASRLIADRPRRLRRLVLVSSPAYLQRMPPFVALARWPRLSSAAMRTVGAHRVVRWAMRQIVYDAGCVTGEVAAGYARALDSAEARRALVAAALQIVPPELDTIVRGLPALDVPTLLLWGRQDRVVPLWVAERLAMDLPRARLHVLERCGHMPTEERPDASLAAMLRFLDAT